MSQIAPPRPPMSVTYADDDGRRGLEARLWRISVTVLTVLITAWFITLGPVPGILALVVAKHVLVAILAMGLGVDATRRSDG